MRRYDMLQSAPRYLVSRVARLRLLREHLALDLVNSVDVVRGRHFDFLEEPALLADWAVAIGLAEAPGEVEHISAITHERTLRLRDALSRHLQQVAGTARGRAPADVPNFETRLIGLYQSIGMAPQVSVSCEHDDRILARLLVAASHLLLPTEIGHVRQCEGLDCEWFFLGGGRSGRRRWCSMEGCGNRAKVAAHRRRVSP